MAHQDPLTRFSDAQLLALSSNTLVWTTSPQGEVVERNPSWELYTGQTEGDYRGWGWLDAVHPDDRDALLSAWKRAVDGGSGLTTTYRLRRRDGVYRLMRAEGSIVTENGGVAGWIGSCHDITELRQTEDALRQSEERLRLLDELSQATRELTDPSEVMATAACALGEHLGTTRCAYADVEPDNDTFTIRADWSRPGVPSSAGVYSLSLFGPRATHNLLRGDFLVANDVDRELGDEHGGRTFNAIGVKAIVCAPLVKAGRLVAMMAVHQAQPRAWSERDIAIVGEVVERCWAHIERIRAEAMLREQDRRKDEFLATLAHELRNPLAPMRYAGAILKRVPPGTSQAVQAQAMIDRQVDMMARLVDDLLDLSRVNRGLIELRKERVDLRRVLDRAVEASHPVIEHASHRLAVALPERELSVEGDPERLIQVVGNLLNNAAKYTPDGGDLRLAAWQDGSCACVEVADNGIGIPPQEQGRLFQMFTQLPHTAGRSQGGLGIGLALVKTLVHMHGGSVQVRSAGIDQGSTFTIELPLARHSAMGAPAAEQTGDAGRPSATRVLVVEDNGDGRAALMSLLGLMGYEVRGAADGVIGLEQAMEFRPDVALVDLGMPRMDGLTLARECRRRPELAGMKLVALTGWGAQSDRTDTAAAGFDRHLTKPVEPQGLQDLLRELTRASVARG